jgi:hypothetical protein
MFRALICPSSGARDYTSSYNVACSAVKIKLVLSSVMYVLCFVGVMLSCVPGLLEWVKRVDCVGVCDVGVSGLSTVCL